MKVVVIELKLENLAIKMKDSNRISTMSVAFHTQVWGVLGVVSLSDHQIPFVKRKWQLGTCQPSFPINF